MNQDKLIEKAQEFAAPVGRVLIALVFLTAGLNKIGTYDNVAGYMDSMGVPGVLLPLVILLEVVGAIAIILGFKTRIAAFLLAGFCVLSALIFHSNFADQNEMVQFMKNLAIAGGFLSLFVHGAGSYSLDNRNG